MGIIPTSRLIYDGHVISDRGEMLSLTDMWKAAGADPQKAPAKWRSLPSSKAFIEHVEVTIGKSDSDLVRTVNGGKTPGTWAHWQVGMAYAKYLDPSFHMWCNQVVRERMEGKVPAAIPDDILDIIRRDDGMIRMLAHKVTEIEKAIPAIIDQAMESRIAGDPRVAVVSFVSVKQLLEGEYKVPAKGRRSIQRKVFVRLNEHCLANGIKAFKCAHSGTWLFPPHEASAFIRQHCSGLIKAHLDRIRGQGALRLVAN